MAKVQVVGNAVVITSGVKMKDIESLAKYNPDALILKGGDDGKEPVFAIAAGNAGGINCVGVTFNGKTRDEQELATLTMTINYTGDNVKEFVADKLGGALIKLNELEAQLPAAIEALNAQHAEVLANIDVI